jgi:hypothetical protein
MKYRYVQNGLISFGAFIALAAGINGWLVLIFAVLFWNND